MSTSARFLRLGCRGEEGEEVGGGGMAGDGRRRPGFAGDGGGDSESRERVREREGSGSVALTEPNRFRPG